MTSSENSPATQLASVSWNDDGLPVSKQFDDIYFSTASGLEESRYVFIDGNQLTERWQQLIPGSGFNIGETGFGSGLNFLAAWQLWENLETTESCQLHFCSVEKYPLSPADLKQALALWPQLSKYSDALINAYPPQPLSGIHQLVFNQGKVLLTLYFGEAAEGFSQFAAIDKAGEKVRSLINAFKCANGTRAPYINAWFLDGFAPAKNPEMWSHELFEKIKMLSGKNTSIATFTVAGIVRKGLQNVGFECKKIKGFGRKREMLIGHLPANQTFPVSDITSQDEALEKKPSLLTTQLSTKQRRRSQNENSWHLISTPDNKNIEHCIVIGGGLAGCHTAFALAQKNIAVTIIEKEPSLATQASGNRQGVVYAKLSPFQDPLSTFNLNAQIYADHFYQTHNFYRNCGDQCGVLHLAVNDRQQQLYSEFAKRFQGNKAFVQWLTREQCQDVSGLKSHYNALYLPTSGWINPVKLCRQLSQHPLISVKYYQDITTLEHNGSWHVSNASGQHICQADAVVIANAFYAQQFHQSQHLPLKHIRGQVSHIDTDLMPTQVKSVICGDGYIAPAHDNHYTFGATFGLNDDDQRLRQSDHTENLNRLKVLSPDLDGIDAQVKPDTLSGKVGFRCTTPDYFPIVGPVARFEDMTQSFALLRKKAKAVIDEPGAYHQNLFCNLAYGSRGLCYAPLSAQLLASLISGDFLPIERQLYRYLHPARFLIRDLMRNKV